MACEGEGQPTVIEGQLLASGIKLGLVVSRFNSFMGERLEAGALDAFTRHGGRLQDVTVVRVPGSFEIPGAARRLVRSGRVDAVVCLGVVIRGGTPHFDYVAAEVSKGIGHLSMEADVPVAMGVLTCDTLEQAIDRAGAKHGNKGAEAVLAAVELCSVYRQLGGA
jgi:6,7-dimethyl-8-ribityllumazine synthase